MANLPVVGGINAQAVRTIPTDWDAQWFKRFITDHMQKMDYRNAIAGTGITITGTEQTTGSISAGGTLTSPVIIPAPATSANALSVTGITGHYAGAFYNPNSGVNSNGVEIYAGSSTSNYALVVGNSAISSNFLLIRGDGAFTFNGNNAQTAYNFGGSLTTTTATAGSSSALPTAPAGYWAIQIDGTNFKIPYYNN